MNKTSRIVAIGLCLLPALLAAPGCMTSQRTTGTIIRDDDVKQLIKGKTTMEEVIHLFGEPTKATPMGDETIYTYEYRVTKSNTAMFPIVTASDSKDEVDKLSIVFDKNKVVKTFNVTRGIGQVR